MTTVHARRRSKTGEAVLQIASRGAYREANRECGADEHGIDGGFAERIERTEPMMTEPKPTEPKTAMTVATIGVLGHQWRGAVTAAGNIAGDSPLEWWVAAEDRWHRPDDEVATLRRRRIDGTPVIETRLRVPGGDIVQRIYAVADAGGITIVEIENESSAAVAIAFSHGNLLTTRPPSVKPPQGITLPEASVVFPLAHRSTLRVGLAHGRLSSGPLPEQVSGPTAVARGWLRHVEQASRLVLPDTDLAERVVAQRCELILCGVDDPADDPIGFLLGVHELVRTGVDAQDWVPEIVDAAESVARHARSDFTWDADRALLATAAVFARVGELKGAGDVQAMRARLKRPAARPVTEPTGVRLIAWVESLLAAPAADGACVLMPDGFPEAWLGQNFETYRLPASPTQQISYAVRWHGERPAVLWEVTGDGRLALNAGTADPSWSSVETTGEALLAAPRR